MRCFFTRSLLTLLSLLLVSFYASAQTGGMQLRSSNQLNQSSQPTNRPVAPESATSAVPPPIETFGRLPDSLVDSLALDSAQRAKLDEAHESRRKMWNTNRLLRQAEYAALTKELSTDKFDPRDVIALRKKTRAKIDAGFDEVQGSWLAFWDVLKPAQRQTLIVYMRDQHTLQGQASAAASAQRAYFRAKQQAALDRAEARAEAQGTSGSTGNTSGRAVPSANTAPPGTVAAPK